ncbi:TonB-dependent receptor [Leptospira perolatii]|uniref:TonB-dependent receptor n=1 Tax=Leptospira perolatii TaxID=2023191 RepID=A0A2M9ZK70_9LEPT|nr:TonB-dependent receptor [Leptospira perolatii]PJZ69330.1 TonB-dependent receptor [Leptospira perolatii]PJZ72465.1 TonB-dependent receptor [Leptospira perolatii]
MEKIVICNRFLLRKHAVFFALLLPFPFHTFLTADETIPPKHGSSGADPRNPNGKNENGWKNEITVTGTRRRGLLKDSTIATEVITRKDIDAMGARDVSDTLGNVPGLEVRPAQAGERGETIRLQGLGSQSVLILVDGQRTTGRFGGAIDLTRFKAEDIERIEIVKGASSALYGSDAIAGVINIITKEAKDPFRAEFRSLVGGGEKNYFGPYLEYRNYGSVGIRKERISTQFTSGWHRGEGYDLTPDATQGPRNGREASLSSSYSPFPTDMPKSVQYFIATRKIPYSPPLESTSGSAFNDLNVSNKTIFKYSENLTLTGQFYYRYLDQGAVDASPPKAVFDRRNRTHDFMGALNSDWEFAKNWNLNLNLNYSRFQDLFTYDQRKSDDLDKKERTDNAVTEFRSRIDRKISENHVLSIGAETLIDQLSSARIAPDCKRNFPNICPEDIRPSSGKPDTKNGNAFRERNAFYVQDEWRISNAPRVQIIPGIRYDHDSIYGGELLPKMAVRYDLTDRIKIRTAAGLGYRAPSFQDLYFNFLNPGVGYRVAGNPDLKPELSRSYNLGLEYEAGKHAWFSLNLFHNNVDNLIGFRTSTNRDPSGLLVYKSSNFQRAITQGIETSINMRLSEIVSAGFGYTFTDSKDLLTKLPLEGRGFHRWNLNLRIDHKKSGAGLSLFAIIFGKQPFYCTKNPLWCDPEFSGDLAILQSVFAANAQKTIQSLFGSIPDSIENACAERNLYFCTTQPTYGFRMVNPHTNLNIRIYKRILGHFQLFAGVDNVLDTFDLRYNPQRPRFYYFGIDGQFSLQDEVSSPTAHSSKENQFIKGQQT